MKHKFPYLVTMALTVAPILGHSQEQCSQILGNGIWDFRYEHTTSSYQKSYVQWFCSQGFSSEQNFKDRGLSLKIPIEGVPVEFKGHDRGKNWKSFYSSACSLQDDFISVLNTKNYFSRVANSDIIKAWQQCIGGDSAGLKLSTAATSSPGLFRIELRYKSQKIPGDSANLKSLSIFQADKSGSITPVSCRSDTVSVDPKTGSAKDVSIPNNGSASLTCQRNVCNAVFVEANADVIIQPSDFLELRPIPDYNSGCVMPPIEACAKYNASGDKCVRCEFDIDAKGAQFQWVERVCSKMPSEERVNVEFEGSLAVTNRGDGSDCWLADMVKGVDEVQLPRRDHTNVASCSVNVSMSSGYKEPKVKGWAIGSVRIDQCQWGGRANMTCALRGKLSVYTPEGQK